MWATQTDFDDQASISATTNDFMALQLLLPTDLPDESALTQSSESRRWLIRPQHPNISSGLELILNAVKNGITSRSYEVSHVVFLHGMGKGVRVVVIRRSGSPKGMDFLYSPRSTCRNPSATDVESFVQAITGPSGDWTAMVMPR
ncbi:hypothetical protein LN996_21720 [Arthrobacter sp. AK01]|uniref:hypothetical protein n=1 Tax=Arthrobacter sp. AK01 TaxID=2894084 RepID=UPI001E32E9E3|nr:hypothetical protein [Arthrobacter sp. AK01]MCD4853448.1 hypothetical protein [Arthrobacter sp. AK01]